MDIDTLRQRAEAFLQRLYRALYQRHIGQLADIPLKQLYEYPGIFTPETILGLREAIAATPETERSELNLLWVFLIEGYLRLGAAGYDEALAKSYDQLTQNGAWARHDAWGASPIISPPASDRLAEQVLTIYGERWKNMVSDLQQIDLDLLSYLRLQSGCEPLEVEQDALSYLERTDPAYANSLDRLRGQFGYVRNRYEMDSALAAPQYLSSFPVAEQVPAIEDTLYHLGIDVNHQPNLGLEIDPSLQPAGSAVAFPVRVPEEIHLVVSPTGGLTGYEQFLRVTGMIMPQLLLSPKQPWSIRRLAQRGSSEAYGELLGGLLGNSTWLVDLLNFDEVVGEFVDLYRFRRLYQQRLAAARVVHLVGRARGQDDYASLFERALGVTHTVNSLWLDMGWQRRAIPTWRGLQQGLKLESSLREQHGPGWYRDPAATTRLRQLMASGIDQPERLVLPS